MAFGFSTSLSGENFETVEMKPTKAGVAYKAGDALIITSGELVKAAPTEKPKFIAAKTYTAPASGQKPLPVYPVLPHFIYETQFSDAGTALIGDQVTLSADSAGVTSTTESGIATISKKTSTNTVYIRFE